MTTLDIFASFDPTPYQTAPHLPLQTLVILSNSLSSRMPDEAPAYVQIAQQEMHAVVEQSEDAMVIRLRETNEVSVTDDLNLDNAVGGLWMLFRDRLRGWARYEHVGLDFLEQDAELEVDFAAVRKKASRARDLTTQLRRSRSHRPRDRRDA